MQKMEIFLLDCRLPAATVAVAVSALGQLSVENTNQFTYADSIVPVTALRIKEFSNRKCAAHSFVVLAAC